MRLILCSMSANNSLSSLMVRPSMFVPGADERGGARPTGDRFFAMSRASWIVCKPDPGALNAMGSGTALESSAAGRGSLRTTCGLGGGQGNGSSRSEEHTSELQSRQY